MFTTLPYKILNENASKTDTDIVGDININLANESFYSNKLKTYYKKVLYQVVQNCTRIPQYAPTIIDLILTADY